MNAAANQEITQALRMAMKSKGLTYRDIAQKVDVSEQTIKRLFREKDCTLSRLTQICEAIDISVYDLLNYAKHHTEQQTQLTRDQEVFLKNQPGHFVFLFLLTLKFSIDDIQQNYALSDASVYRYLRNLDQLGLIALAPENKCRLLIEGHLLMKLHGPLHEMIKIFNGQFLEYVIDHDGDNGVAFNSSLRYMAPNTLTALSRDLINLSDKYRKLSHKDEMILPKDKMLSVKWTTLVGPYNLLEKWEIPEL